MTVPAELSLRLHLDHDDVVPLYYQLREQLRSAASELGSGIRMPSESELMRLAGVSRATARKAVSDLVQEGILRSQRGRGTFTAPGRLETRLDRPAGFSETLRRQGRRPSARVLLMERVAATPEFGTRLSIPRGSDMVVIERLRYLDDEPVMVERTHMPAALVPEIESLDLSGSLYELLRDTYSLVPAQGVETIVAVNADSTLASLLEVPEGAALLATVRTTETEGRIPLEYTLRHARGDMTAFAVSLSGGSVLGDRANIDPLPVEPAG